MNELTMADATRMYYNNKQKENPKKYPYVGQIIGENSLRQDIVVANGHVCYMPIRGRK